MRLINKLRHLFAFSAVSLVIASASAQDPSFAVYIDNPAYVSNTQYEFDVMVKAMGSTTNFQLRTFQAGIYVDPTWVASGTVSVANVTSSSQLSAPGYNGTFNWNATDNLINCSVNTGVRTTSASCVSTTTGTAPVRVARLRLTNSVNFACVPPNIKFNYVQNGNPLRLRTASPGVQVDVLPTTTCSILIGCSPAMHISTESCIPQVMRTDAHPPVLWPMHFPARFLTTW
jgi:hypothetical protein